MTDAPRTPICDLLGAINEHQVEPLMHSPAGQGIAMFNRETTVAEVMQQFIDEARQSLGRLSLAWTVRLCAGWPTSSANGSSMLN
jgi:hypothetical protein